MRDGLLQVSNGNMVRHCPIPRSSLRLRKIFLWTCGENASSDEYTRKWRHKTQVCDVGSFELRNTIKTTSNTLAPLARESNLDSWRIVGGLDIREHVTPSRRVPAACIALGKSAQHYRRVEVIHLLSGRPTSPLRTTVPPQQRPTLPQ